MKAMFWKACDGNPGVMSFCTEAYRLDPRRSEAGIWRMLTNGITGDKLYMIWNDCCDRDTAKALRIITTHPIEDIVRRIDHEEYRGITCEENENGD